MPRADLRMPHKAAIVLGASGSVGQALLAEIVASRQFSPVIVVERRPLDPKVAGVVERLVPQMDPRPSRASRHRCAGR